MLVNRKTLQSVVALSLIGLASQSYAGGLYLYELGTEDLGLAGVGSAARAEDASTVATNPAGMTRLDGSQLGGCPIIGIFSQIEASRKNKHSHIVDITSIVF